MKLLRIVVVLLAGIVAAPAWSQAYPAKPVRVVVTFPPGGTPDIYGRIMAAELAKAWNQPVVVENRTGAGGTIGTDSVAKSAPDGYTLLFAADASITIAPHLYSKLPYDPVRDFAPIVNVAAGPFVMLAQSVVPGEQRRGDDRAGARQSGQDTATPRRARAASSTSRWRRCDR